MTLTLDLTPDQEQQLNSVAAREGLPVAEYIRRRVLPVPTDHDEESLLPLSEVVWIDGQRLSGAPCFTHTRVPIKALFDYLEGGETIEAFLEDFDGVTRAQALSAIYYGKDRLMPSGVPQPTGDTRDLPPLAFP